ncbi:hypothetical protein [Azospirillum argentinense]|uniref:hypothetical protein n=1 Tax=Azospirillum argentinense TaxID=2970906 RepID=UPI0032DE750B
MKPTTLAAVALALGLGGCVTAAEQQQAAAVAASATTLDECYALRFELQEPCINRVMFDRPNPDKGKCLKAENADTPDCRRAREFIIQQEARRADPAARAVDAMAFCSGTQRSAWSRTLCYNRLSAP